MKKRKRKSRCQKCGRGIEGKICYYRTKRFCRTCFSNIKYEGNGRRRMPRGHRGRPPDNPIKLF